MTEADIPALRLLHQQIAATKYTTPQDLVSWMGVMQAQDQYMAKWAVGIRLTHTTEGQINKALDKGDILRTHVLRPTWHLVAAEDIRWLLELTAPHIKAAQKSRHKQLELTEAVLTKSRKVIEKILEDEESLTRDEVLAALENAKIATHDQRASHILFMAELEGLICSGPLVEKHTTYSLLDKRVPKAKPMKKEEALGKLAGIYFSSRSPATLQDFTNWSSLSITQAKEAVEAIKESFISEKIGNNSYWLPTGYKEPESPKDPLYLLPAFDEYVIGYKDRSAILTKETHKIAISINGIFWPTIVYEGKVIGLWKRTIKKEVVIVETDFFTPVAKKVKDLVEKKSKEFGNFLEKKVEIKHNNE